MKHLFCIVALLLLALPSQGQVIGLYKTSADNNLTASSGFNLTPSANEGVLSGATLEFKSGSIFQIDAGTTLNWPVNIVPTSALQNNVTTQGNTFNGTSQLVQTDSGGYVPIDPWGASYLPKSQVAVIELGDSRKAGYTLATPSTQSEFNLIQNLPWFKAHVGAFYNFAVGGAITQQNGVQGSTSTVTPTTQAGTWSGATNSITLSGSNASIKVHEQVSGTGILYGSTVATISGTALTLTPPAGQTNSTSGSGSGVTLSFAGNDIYDQFVTYAEPLLGTYTRVIVIEEAGVNTLANGYANPLTQYETDMTAFVTLVKGFSGVTLIPETIIPCGDGNTLGWSAINDSYLGGPIGANYWLRSGQSGIPAAQVHDIAKVITTDTAQNDGMSSDALHPNAAAHILWANDLNTFMQSNGRAWAENMFETPYLEKGVVIGPNNAAQLFDDLTVIAITGGKIYGQTPNAGYGAGWYSLGTEWDFLQTPSIGTAGGFFNTNSTALDIPLKILQHGILALGNTINNGTGSTLGSTIIANGETAQVTVTGLAVMSAPTLAINGTAGTTSYSYSTAPVAADGVTLLAAPSAVATIATGPASPNGSNNVGITYTSPAGAKFVNIYRTLGGTGTGLIKQNAASAAGLSQSVGDSNLTATGSVPTTASADFGSIKTNHLIGVSGTPTIAAGAGAGTSPTVSISGNDMYGTVTITTGTSPSASAIVATVTFNVPYTTAPTVDGWAPKSANAEAIISTGAEPYPNSESTTTFVITSGATPLSASTTYVFSYRVN